MKKLVNIQNDVIGIKIQEIKMAQEIPKNVNIIILRCRLSNVNFG